ncbi:hypothetical protein PR048_028296 [Dryococelus australis]|uniref:DUF4371 domain-containing protein n=1 Tax=Dryococelus australis TaxID=614101 RepID=A0ABQ9GIR3_9NEOP|nr:hypothetical protein PR048_028296 [Dryococelus australis]
MTASNVDSVELQHWPDVWNEEMWSRKKKQAFPWIDCRQAYYIAQNYRPYSDYLGLIELQKLSGVDVATNKGCFWKISIIIDEWTSLCSKSVLIIYLRCEISKEQPPTYLFLDLVELSDENLLCCLEKHGFDSEYLKQHLVGFSSEGASVIIGKHSGVAQIGLFQYPNIITWHCMNHRLELSLADSVEVGGVNHFHIFMDKLYISYSRSPMNRRRLAECAAELDK